MKFVLLIFFLMMMKGVEEWNEGVMRLLFVVVFRLIRCGVCGNLCSGGVLLSVCMVLCVVGNEGIVMMVVKFLLWDGLFMRCCICVIVLLECLGWIVGWWIL